MKDNHYLTYIRSQPCLITGRTPSTPHHTVTKGAGGSDYLTVPLTEPYHTDLNQGVHGIGRETFQERHNIDFKDEIIRLLIGYIRGNHENKQ